MRSPLSTLLRNKKNKTTLINHSLRCLLLYFVCCCLNTHYFIMPDQTQIPRVLWAQQREHVLLTIAVPDIEKVDVKFEDVSVSFKGESTSTDANEKNIYQVKIDLYEKID